MIALIRLLLAILKSPFKSKSRLEAENAALRRQLVVLQRKVKGRAAISNGDRLFFVQLYRWVPVDPRGPHDHPARDIGALASGRLSSLLALEVTATRRAAADSAGAACANPADESREPAVGRAAHSWRIADEDQSIKGAKCRPLR